jgi:YHS domain-containing protein
VAANLENLTRRIEELVSAANQRMADQMRQTAEEASAQQIRLRSFNEFASGILHDEIVVRLNQLEKYFSNARVELIEAVGTYGAICRFKHTVRFPASVELTLTCSHDDHVEQFLCGYNLEILPLFIKFDKHDQIASPLDQFDRSSVVSWLDDRIVRFLETYLQLEFIDQYQRQNQATDPVTQSRMNVAFAAANSTYKGHTYYFLSEQNRDLFEAAPEQYIAS